jgi:hypothetical protein
MAGGPLNRVRDVGWAGERVSVRAGNRVRPGNGARVGNGD